MERGGEGHGAGEIPAGGLGVDGEGQGRIGLVSRWKSKEGEGVVTRLLSGMPGCEWI